MRPLKPYLVAMSGLIAAVFSAVFSFAPIRATSAVPTPATQPDLQSKSVVPSNEVLASRDAKAANKTPAPQPYFPAGDFSSNDILRSAPDFTALPQVRVPERIVDRRSLLLVGVVELRI